MNIAVDAPLAYHVLALLLPILGVAVLVWGVCRLAWTASRIPFTSPLYRPYHQWRWRNGERVTRIKSRLRTYVSNTPRGGGSDA